MRYVQLLFSRLVRTQAGLLSRPALPANYLQPARALHDFGDPDKFGDLKQPVEKPREHAAEESTPPESAAHLRSDSDRSDRSGYRGRSEDRHERGLSGPSGQNGRTAEMRRDWGRVAEREAFTAPDKADRTSAGQTEHFARKERRPWDDSGDTHERGLSGADGQSDRTAEMRRDWGRAVERDAFTAPETADRTSAGQTEHSARKERRPWDDGHATETKGNRWRERGSFDDRRAAPASARDRPTTEPAAGTAGNASRVVTSSTDGDVTSGVIDWELEEDDAEDVAAEQLRQVVSQIPQLGISCHAYGRKFKGMIKNGKLREALELFENQMLQVDKTQPDSYCYNVLISGCAKAGYTKMAFKLYRDMRRRRLKVTHVTYTSLVNACANGPSPSDGLRRIQQLTNAMAERGYMMNVINYQALVKAYGRCGELQRAFETADELLQLGHPLTAELASFLLQACISDTSEGFRHAVLVWHKLRSKQVEPSIYLYNLMLRAALDCGAGDTATFEQAMQVILSAPPPGGAAIGTSTAAPSVSAGGQTTNSKTSSNAESTDSRDSRHTESIPSTGVSNQDSTDSVDSPGRTHLDSSAAEERTPAAVVRVTDGLRSAGALQAAADLPDLLALRPHRGGLLRLNHLDTAPARLGVLGGWTGLLQTMAADGIQPDIRTFSLLLKTMPNQQEQEESLLMMMDTLGVQPDVGFFNQLIKKRASCRNNAGAKAAFSQLGQRGLQPNVASFGCLSMTVRNMEDMDEFMDTLKAAEMRPNVEVLTSLLNSAVRGADARRSLAVMEAFLTHQVRPDRRTLIRLEELRLRLQTLLVDRERGRPVPPAAQRDTFPDWVRKFQMRYARWLSEIEAEAEPHPHRQYRVRPLTETAAAATAAAAAAADPTGAGAGAGPQLTAGQS